MQFFISYYVNITATLAITLTKTQKLATQHVQSQKGNINISTVVELPGSSHILSNQRN